MTELTKIVINYQINYNRPPLNLPKNVNKPLLPEAKYLPSGENATEVTVSKRSCSCSVVTSFCDSTFQSLTRLPNLPKNVNKQLLPEAKYLPSGENATELTDELWPCSVVNSFCDSTLQSLTVLSSLPEAKYLPSGENAMERTD